MNKLKTCQFWEGSIKNKCGAPATVFILSSLNKAIPVGVCAIHFDHITKSKDFISKFRELTYEEALAAEIVAGVLNE